jgi:hypothetical protein
MVTLHDAETPFAEAAVTVQEPAAKAVTVPPDTLALLLSVEVHVSVLSVAVYGAIVGVSVAVAPTFNVRELLSSITAETGTTSGADTVFCEDDEAVLVAFLLFLSVTVLLEAQELVNRIKLRSVVIIPTILPLLFKIFLTLNNVVFGFKIYLPP